MIAHVGPLPLEELVPAAGTGLLAARWWMMVLVRRRREP
jgi:hypothetical protein